MHRLSLTAALATAAIGAVGVAQAVTPTTEIAASVSPTTKGTTKKPRNVKLSIELKTTPRQGEAAFATRSTVVHLDRNLKFGGRYLKTCTKSKVLSNNTKCPKGSKVGTGSASAFASALSQTENLKITAYNGPRGKQIELLVVGTAPLPIRDVLEGKLMPDSGLFGQKLVVNIPDTLQQPLQGVFATLTDFKVAVKGTGSKKRPYVGLAGCTNGTLNYQADFVFSDGTTSTATTTSPCS